MQTSFKVILNSIILYTKILISIVINLVSVPLVLKALGNEDYGLYCLIAGVISMLAFLNTSMSISIQRYLSVSIGEKNTVNLHKVYNVGLLINILIGIAIIAIFEIAYPFLFNGFLNINPDRVPVAKIVYQLLVLNTFFTILSVPFEALLNAKEDMLSYSIVNIAAGFFKLALALVLSLYAYDRLIFYSVGMMVIALAVLIVYFLLIRIKYKDIEVSFTKYTNKDTFRQMIGYTGWNTFGAVAMLGRNQGLAIIINLFWGTIANTAYGIANQINGALNYFSATFQKAINPQLMQSEGMNDKDRLIRLSCTSSKFSILVLSIIAVPLIIEMHFVLGIWLGDIPMYTLMMSQLTLILAIVFQYSSGLISSIQAVGKIKWYQIIMSVIILLNLPISYFLLKAGCSIYTIIIVCIILELISFLIRLLQSKYLVGFNIKAYITEIVLPSLMTIVIPIIPCYFIHTLFGETWLRFLLVFTTYIALFSFFAWRLVLNNSDKDILTGAINKILTVIKR